MKESTPGIWGLNMRRPETSSRPPILCSSVSTSSERLATRMQKAMSAIWRISEPGWGKSECSHSKILLCPACAPVNCSAGIIEPGFQAPAYASFMFSDASSSPSPSERQPGRPGHSPTYLLSSVILNFISPGIRPTSLVSPYAPP